MKNKSSKPGKVSGRKTREKLVSVSQFGVIVGKKSQAVYPLISAGEIIRKTDGMINLFDPTNKRYLKTQGISSARVVIPEPGKPGRPVSPQAPKPTRDMESTELRRIRAVQQILHLQGRKSAERGKLVSVRFVHDFANVYLKSWEIENETFVGSVCRILPAYFKIENPSPAMLSEIADAVRHEIESVQTMRRAVVEKFFKKIKHHDDTAMVPEKLQRKIATIPIHVKQLASRELSFDELSMLTKDEISKLKLILEISVLESKIQVQRGDYIQKEIFKQLNDQLRSIDVSNFTNIYIRTQDMIRRVFKCSEDDLFYAQNAVWEAEYPILNAVKSRISEFMKNYKE